MNLIGTILVYAGLLAVLLGCISIVHLLTFLKTFTRPRAVIVFAAGAAAFLAGANLPVREKRIENRVTALDDFLPTYQFGEFHAIRIKAPRERVYQAVREVSANEIFLFRTLTWIRRLGRPGRENILNAPPDKPLLDVALRTSFMKLAEEPDREIVLGTLVAAPKGTRLK